MYGFNRLKHEEPSTYVLWGLRGDSITVDRPIWGPPFVSACHSYNNINIDKPTWNQNQIGCLLVHQVQKYNALAEGPPQNCLPTQALHRFLAPPKVDIILERQKVEEQVNSGHAEGDQQKDQVGISKNALDFICVFVCESHGVHGAQGRVEL